MLACYAVSLTSNETIFCKTIKSSTVNLYLADATKLAIFKKLSDPTKNLLQQKYSYITNVIDEHRRWESMPHRGEPLPFLMMDYAYKSFFESASSHEQDFLECSSGGLAHHRDAIRYEKI